MTDGCISFQEGAATGSTSKVRGVVESFDINKTTRFTRPWFEPDTMRSQRTGEAEGGQQRGIRRLPRARAAAASPSPPPARRRADVARRGSVPVRRRLSVREARRSARGRGDAQNPKLRPLGLGLGRASARARSRCEPKPRGSESWWSSRRGRGGCGVGVGGGGGRGEGVSGATRRAPHARDIPHPHPAAPPSLPSPVRRARACAVASRGSSGGGARA